MRHWQRSPRTLGRSGFSLAEVVLVTVIVGILGAIALPRYSAYAAQQQLEGAARRVVADLAYAQRNARQASASRTVVFDVPRQLYSLTGVNDLDHKSNAYVVRLSDEPYRVQIVSASFGGDAQLIYDGYGTPDSAGTLILAVGTLRKTISIDTGAGKAIKGITQELSIQ